MSTLYLKIGNSRTRVATNLRVVMSLPTQSLSEAKLKKILKLSLSDRLHLVSVVPAKTNLIRKIAKRRGFELFEWKTPNIPLRTEARGLGSDRLLNAYAASSWRKKNCVVIDFGTATTVDFVQKSPRHLGGWIVPGQHLQAWSLAKKTALLPFVLPAKRKIGKTLGMHTRSAIQNGLLHQAEGLVLEAQRVAQKNWGRNFEIVLTGGGLPKNAGPIFTRRKFVVARTPLSGAGGMIRPPYEELVPELKPFLNPANPKALLMTAKAMAPIPPQKLIPCLCFLALDSDPTLSEAAQKSLKEYPEKNYPPILSQAQPPWALWYLSQILKDREGLLEIVLLNPETPTEVFLELAFTCSERLTNIIANNQERIIESPEIVPALEKNPHNLKSNTDRLRQFLRLAGIFVPGDVVTATAEVKKEAAPQKAEAPPDDQEEFTEEKRMSLGRYILSLSIGARVKLGLKGNKEARGILIRDANKVVATAVLRSPKINENEIVHYSGMKNLAEDVIREISRNPAWTKNYAVKLNLLMHPKTPVQTSMNYIKFMTLRDLGIISKSKTVLGPLRKAAKELLSQKQK